MESLQEIPNDLGTKKKMCMALHIRRDRVDSTPTSRIKFRWSTMSMMLLYFASFLTTMESFVVLPRASRHRIQKGSVAGRSKLFQTVNDIDDEDASPMEFRSIPNKPVEQEHKYNVSLLVIDHYDSFTYNLWDMLAQLTVDPPVVVAKDSIDPSTTDVVSYFQQFDGIVLSPGPGTPQEQPAFSHLAISQNPELPVLGVCLGHQLMSLAYGARVDRAPIPIHGQDHQILKQDDRDECDKDYTTKEMFPSLFRNLPSSFRVVRYHSLCAYDLPESLTVTARSRDDVVQAIQHASNPHYGVQFHPESIGTENGIGMLENFVQVVEEYKRKRNTETGLQEQPKEETITDAQHAATSKFRVMVHRIESQSTVAKPLPVFEKFYAWKSHAIWLDSSSYHTGRGEIDIMAAPCRDDDILEYHIDGNHGADEDILSSLERGLFGEKGGTVNPSMKIGWVEFDNEKSSTEWTEEDQRGTETLPFHYRGGFLGFLGYEVRHDTQRYLQELEGGVVNKKTSKQRNKRDDLDLKKENRCPTAAFFLARHSVVYHHPTESWYLIGIGENDSDFAENLSWMKEMAEDLKGWSSALSSSDVSRRKDAEKIEFIPNRPKETYKDDVAKCHEYIKKGDSYELCLTNQLEAQLERASIRTFDLYRTIREVNPAPYSSYFRWNLPSSSVGGDGTQCSFADKPESSSLVICSSSPERFMSVSTEQPHPEIPSYLQAEAKPIKGTCARVMPQNGVCLSEAESREDERRARSLELSLKNRAENLMIVDLLRNDMSRVCKTGSVHVSKLMDIESFATVHQMVSTIRGTLSDSCNSIDLLRASFPGGSMTGAPKLRTMEILEDLEEHVDRGPYSGSLGYLSINGCMDMNIMIRSATVTPSSHENKWKIRIGAGGAITALSEAEDEYDEMLLKARAVKEAVQRWVSTLDSHDESVHEPSDSISKKSTHQ